MKKLEKRNKKDIIKFLSVDPIFGVYTRKYMDYLIITKNLRLIYILDFDDIGKLNDTIGYDKVNSKMKKIFKKKYNGVYIGRFFSGDEMILAFDNNFSQKDAKKIIKKIKIRSKKEELSFKSACIGLSDSESPGSSSGMDGGHREHTHDWVCKMERLKHKIVLPKDELKSIGFYTLSDYRAQKTNINFSTMS